MPAFLKRNFRPKSEFKSRKKARPSRYNSQGDMKLSLSRVLSSVNRTHKILQASEGSIVMNQSLGWNSAGYALSFAFSGQNVVFGIGGGGLGAFGTGNFANSANYSAIFDEYRIKKVWCELYYTANSNPQALTSGTASHIVLPIVFSVLDYTDSGFLTSAANALAYSTQATHQFGNSSGSNNGRQTVVLDKPTAQLQAIQTTGAAASASLKVSPWLSTDFMSIEHNSMKFWYEPVDTSYASNIGQITFVFKQIIEFRHTR